jgi:hypothetical protein
MVRKIFVPVLFLLFFLVPLHAHAALCQLGDDAMVLWGGKWWQATVVEVNPSRTRCKVHYKGYGENWDEWVGPDRIRTQSANSLWMGTPNTPNYRVGQAVRVQWKGNWYNAHILELKQNKYLIKYDDYGSEWNEWVGVGRIRPR